MNKWIFLLIGLMVTPAFAVRTSYWTHRDAEDFEKGTLQNVVVTSLGDLMLSREVQKLLERDPDIDAVFALTEGPDGTIYAGTGPHGVILRLRNGQVERHAQIDYGISIFALASDEQGRLLVGTGGERGRVLRIDDADAEPLELFSDEQVQYIWALQRTDDGAIYAATGPNGQLFEILPQGRHRIVLDSDESNLLSLISDGGDLLFVGTDPNGLVYRVNRNNGDVFVLYDAPESEISALAMDRNGNLYAATAKATEEMLPDEWPAAPGPMGRPEVGDAEPIPGEAPDDPTPPELPDPAPGDDPIPHLPDPLDAEHDLEDLPVMPDAPADFDEAPDGDPAPDLPPAEEAEPLVEDVAPAQVFGRQPHARDPQQPASNAIYRINPEGFVTEIFRQPVLVLSMVEQDGVLLVGAGSERGLIYQINPAAEETTVLAEIDPRQVMSLLAAEDGHVYLGLANAGGVAVMGRGLADEGTYTSPVLDAVQISRFGRLHLRGTLPEGTTLQVSTRSGNVREPRELGWSDWTEPVDASRFVPIESPAARFFQYRLSFGGGERSAAVEQVQVAYQMPNLPPQVRAVRVAPKLEENQAIQPGQIPRAPVYTVSWAAVDPNADPLRYELYVRVGPQAPWIQLAEGLTESEFEWDTRTMADGRYELMVVASDELANPPGTGRTARRISSPFLVDNTPPVIGDLEWEVRGNAARIEFTVVDRTSTVAAVHYSINSSDGWQAVLPSDNIFDSPRERVAVTIPDLAPGAHQVAIRATDSRGNQGYEYVLIQIDARAGQ